MSRNTGVIHTTNGKGLQVITWSCQSIFLPDLAAEWGLGPRLGEKVKQVRQMGFVRLPGGLDGL